MSNSSDGSPPRGLLPGDALPPVEPPNAGFILQLFIVPGVIVLVVVTIWVMFNWLAQKGNDSDAFVRALARNNEARWQAAFNLANALRAERGSKHPRLTADPQLARQLAEILDREIDAASMEKNPLELRIYLCRALGEFRVADALPTLIRAATTQRDEREADVRRAGLEGIALLADRAGSDGPPFVDNQQLNAALLDASRDAEPRTRTVAAVALGVVGGEQNLARLRELVDDTHPDVRYNAAVRLAQRGDTTAIPVLAEMLDLDQSAGVAIEPSQELRPFKRTLITVNALRAAGQLASHEPTADTSSLVAAIEKILAGDAAGEIRVEATSALRQLNSRAPAAGH